MEDVAGMVTASLPRRKRAVREDALAILRGYHWPGNIRELRNIIERAVIVEEGDVITPEALPPLEGELVATAARSQWPLEHLESCYIREILRQTRTNYSRTSAIL